MSHYLIAQLKITDREEYGRYESGFMDIFTKFQGKLLAVDEETKPLEGDWPWTRTVLLEFPDEDAAMKWYQSPEYQELAQHRFNSSTGNIVLVRGL